MQIEMKKENESKAECKKHFYLFIPFVCFITIIMAAFLSASVTIVRIQMAHKCRYTEMSLFYIYDLFW